MGLWSHSCTQAELESECMPVVCSGSQSSHLQAGDTAAPVRGVGVQAEWASAGKGFEARLCWCHLSRVQVVPSPFTLLLPSGTSPAWQELSLVQCVYVCVCVASLSGNSHSDGL